MRLSIVFLCSVLAVVVSSCDAASTDQTKISKMATTGEAHAEVLAPLGIRSLRGYEMNEDEDRRFIFGVPVASSIDDIVAKLAKNEMTLSHALEHARVVKHMDKLVAKTNYMDDLFTKAELEEMLVNSSYAYRRFLDWYGISKKVGLADDAILARLKSVHPKYETLRTQYVAFIKELEKRG